MTSQEGFRRDPGYLLLLFMYGPIARPGLSRQTTYATSESDSIYELIASLQLERDWDGTVNDPSFSFWGTQRTSGIGQKGWDLSTFDILVF